MTSTSHATDPHPSTEPRMSLGDHSPTCTSDVLSTDSDFESIAGAWDQLFCSIEDAQPYLHRAWVTSWRAAAPPRTRTCVLAVRRDGVLTGLFPLQVSRVGPLRVARPIGTGLPSYLGVLADHRDSESLAAMADAVVQRRHFDMLIMHDVYSRDAATNLLLAVLSSKRASVLRRHRAHTHLIRLRPTFDEYLQTHSAKSRQTLRRKRRKLTSTHDIRVQRFDGEALDGAMLRRIADIQAASWMRKRGADVFADAFFRDLIEEMGRAGLARAWVLSVDGTDAAFMLALCAGDALIYKWTAFTLEHAELSVGQYLTAATIEDCCAQGVRWYDFSHGEAAYKSFWSTDSAEVSRVIAGCGLLGKVAGHCLASLWDIHQTSATQTLLRKARSLRTRQTR